MRNKTQQKISAYGTTTLFRNEFKYTTETKKVNFFYWKETVFGSQVH